MRQTYVGLRHNMSSQAEIIDAVSNIDGRGTSAYAFGDTFA
jgi:hypothetical protein